MFQIRLHGRGGQGVVTAAEMLAVAGFHSSLHSQSFPSFGSERMGAPVMAFCRFHDKAIRLREPVVDPDVLWVQDDSLFHEPAILQGLKADGILLVNTRKDAKALGLSQHLQKYPGQRLYQIPATELGREFLGRPVPNAAMLGAFTAIYLPVNLSSVQMALKERFTASLAEANQRTAIAGREWILKHYPISKGGNHVEAN